MIVHPPRFSTPVLLVTLFVLMALMMAGCAQAPAAPAAGDTAASAEAGDQEFSGDLTLAIWGQIDADPNHASYAYHEILQQWAELHPEVNLKYELVGGTTVPDRFNWIQTHMAAGTLPDVVMIYFPADDFRDPDLLYDFTADLQKPNPYSDNPTWWDDFPYDAMVLEEYKAPEGEVLFIGPTLSGDTGVTTIVYNKDIFDEVGVDIPQTWAEFMEVQQQIQDAGYTPFFQPTAGTTGWLLGWPTDTLVDEMMDEVIKTCDFEAPTDIINVKEMTWCVKSGNFRTDDPHFMEAWRLMKDWSAYWQEGFLAPPPEGQPFAQGTVAMQHLMNLWINQIANNPEITFEWGTFYQPDVTEASTDLSSDAKPRRMGNHGQPGSGSQFLMIPQTTVDKGKLAMALDLVQFTTAPEQLDYWCSKQPIPCFVPGTPIEEVYPDQPETWQHLRGFFEPGSFENGIREFRWTTFGHDADTQAMKLMQDYLGDAISLEDAMAELQMISEEEADKAIREHPEWNADQWSLDTPPTP